MDIGWQETNLSAHEKQQGKVKKRIEQLEKANMDTKSWTMQGEVYSSILEKKININGKCPVSISTLNYLTCML